MSGLSGMVYSGKRGRLLKTGQTTQYSSELDDGYYQMGLAKAYTILTTGQYSGTANVDLIHYTAATISFELTDKHIHDSANGLAQFKTNDKIVITGSASNNGVYTVATGNVAGTIVVTEALVNEAAGATVSIAKREALSNNCVLDKNTGLMWACYQGTKQGTASNGKMPWTGQLYDIFQFCIAANAALLGGFSDWRVPNVSELFSLIYYDVSLAPNVSAFPSWPSLSWPSAMWTSTSTETYAVCFSQSYGFESTNLKTAAFFCALVRGG